MEQSQTDAHSDIATEAYKGPSARVAAAGQGFIEHLFYAAAGLISAGIFAYIFHKPATKIVEGARNLGTRLKAPIEGPGILTRSKDTLTNWAGGALHVAFGDVEAAESIASLSKADHKHADWLANMAHNKRQGFGNMFLSHTIGALPWVGMGFKQTLRELDARKSTAIAFGGAAGVVGYVGGWAKALLQGSRHGNDGKRQFERARAEIEHLREVNKNLNTVNDQLHAKVVEVSTKFKDSAPDISDTPEDSSESKTVHKMADIPAAVALHAAEHQGKLHAEKAAEPAMA